MPHLLICATQRSGSTLVAELLAQTGVAGFPDEFLLLWLRDRQRTEAAFWLETIQRTVDAGMTKNGVFSCKVMANYFVEAMDLLRAIPGGEGLDAWQIATRAFVGPQVIRVRRRERLRQAISIYIAESTGIYHMARRSGASDPFLRGALAPPRADHGGDVAFDFERIRSHLAGIETGERYWDETFARHHVRPFEVIYEEFVRDRRAQVLAMLDFMRVTYDPARITLDEHLDRLSNATNERFLDLYREEEARRSPHL